MDSFDWIRNSEDATSIGSIWVKLHWLEKNRERNTHEVRQTWIIEMPTGSQAGRKIKNTFSLGKHRNSLSGSVETINFTWSGSDFGNQDSCRAPPSGDSWSSESNSITRGLCLVADDKTVENFSIILLVSCKSKIRKKLFSQGISFSWKSPWVTFQGSYPSNEAEWNHLIVGTDTPFLDMNYYIMVQKP